MCLIYLTCVETARWEDGGREDVKDADGQEETIGDGMVKIFCGMGIIHVWFSRGMVGMHGDY